MEQVTETFVLGEKLSIVQINKFGTFAKKLKFFGVFRFLQTYCFFEFFLHLLSL